MSSNRRRSNRLTRRRTALALILAVLGAALWLQPASAGTGAPRAHAASSFLTGIGDEHVAMFSQPIYQRLHTKIVRYIAPYDAVKHAASLNYAIAFIRAAEADHEQVLVAFYHSEYTPTVLPSVSSYQHDVEKFVKRFPHVRQYQSWDESNRGNVPRAPSRAPRRCAAARYYQALLRVCNGCTVIGLDVLDAQNIGPTLSLHLRIQARDRPPAHGHAVDLGPAQLLRHQPPAELAHAPARARAGRPGVAHRDRWDREIPAGAFTQRPRRPACAARPR